MENLDKNFDFGELKRFLENLEHQETGEQLETDVGEIVIEVDSGDDNEIILLDDPDSDAADVEITIDDDLEANVEEEVGAVEPVLEDSPAKQPAQVDASDQYLIEQVEKALDILVEDDTVKASDPQSEEEEDEEEDEEDFEDRDHDGIPDEEEPHGELPEDFHGTHDDAMALKGETSNSDEKEKEEVEVNVQAKDNDEELDVEIDLSDFDFDEEEEEGEEESEQEEEETEASEQEEEEEKEEEETGEEDDWF